MKKSIFYFVTFLSISFMLNSCSKEEESFDETLLIGTWKEGTVYEKYQSNYDGYTWDTADNVTEDEAQLFHWTLVKSDLTQIHIMESSGTEVPKYYTVIELSSTTLKYRDDLATIPETHTFTKINP